ncbi:response regulator transcription factor [Aquimarina sp. 2201CG14-23]|uniref:response regulator transcription factor n=1 Tax=Aquimarina mycalae TaxID=3040073 RepID=UPI0024780CA8|nr:response regulator transcription factor [Aquimarina sp. 2201CG14-23]MDH7447394.1 helix-turn-helix transcriptional regulator [Aquimarina sp. 2201CG14-23]
MIFSTTKGLSLYLLLLISIVTLTISKVQAQETSLGVPDSLQNKTPEELTKYVKNANMGEAFFYENIIQHKYSSKINVPLYLELGRRFYFEGNYKKCHKYLNIVIEEARQSKNNEAVCVASLIKANAFMLDGEQQKAFELYNLALDISKKQGDLNREIIANSGLMVVLSNMNQLDKAIEVSRNIIEDVKRSSYKNKKNHVRLLSTINEVFLTAEQYDSVLYYANEGIRIGDSLGFKEGITDLYVKRGTAFYYKGNCTKSQEELFKAKELLNQNELKSDFHQKVNTNYFLARCDYDKGLYDKAILHLQTTVNTLKEEDFNKLPVIQSYLLLANCYGKKENFKEESYWLNQYRLLKEKYQKNKDKTVNKIFEREAKILKKERDEVTREKIKEQRTKNYLLVGILIISLALAIVVFRYIKRQKSNRILFNELVEKIDNLETQEKDLNLASNEKSKEIIIDDDTVVDILKRLDKLEQQEYFLRSDCNLRSIAKRIKTNATYLSKIINTHKAKNFNDYINDLRIEYALKRLKNDRKFRSFSVKSIATEIGYKSDYSFAKHFKAKTGLNPSYYIKNIGVVEEKKI